MPRKPHRTGSYDRYAALVRRAAYADPSTRCARCGLTLAEQRVHKPDDRWDAGHVNDGQVGGELRPEHSSCNRSHGALEQARRRRMRFTTSRDW